MTLDEITRMVKVEKVKSKRPELVPWNIPALKRLRKEYQAIKNDTRDIGVLWKPGKENGEGRELSTAAVSNAARSSKESPEN